MSEKKPLFPLFSNLWEKEARANSVERAICNCLDRNEKENPFHALQGNLEEGLQEWEKLNETYTPDPEEKDEALKEWYRLRDSLVQEIERRSSHSLQLHCETQDESLPGWRRLLELIDQAASDGREVFSPVREMKPEEWQQIITLPPSIKNLKSVVHLIVYGSSLVRIPPEIGEMTNLEEFTPYTSYRLHWFPYEILRCKQLKQSTVSTRALYGNSKTRLPFPALPQHADLFCANTCSVCNTPFNGAEPIQRWTSLLMGSDIVPLLVNVCSEKCIEAIPDSPQGYVTRPHLCGLELKNSNVLPSMNESPDPWRESYVANLLKQIR